MLIAVDHGNKLIKTVHCAPFTSGLRRISGLTRCEEKCSADAVVIRCLESSRKVPPFSAGILQ